MRKGKRILSLLLISILLITLLGGCADQSEGGGNVSSENGQKSDTADSNKKGDEGTADLPENFNAQDLLIVNEPITLKFFARKFVTHADWKDMMVWKEYEKLTNIHIEWELVSDENITERRNIVMASGELPDAFHTAKFGSSDIVKYANEGMFLRVDDLIGKYAPNLNTLLQDPLVKAGMTLEDGGMYSFPYLAEDDFLGVRAGSKLWYNTAWLKALGKSQPTNTEEFYQLLKAIKEADPNGNGKADEIPFAPQDVGGLISLLKGSWGLGNRGNGHPNVDVDEETGELRFIPTDPRYKEILEYANMLYKEGLFDELAFTPDWSKHVAQGQEGLYGSFYGIGPILYNQVGNYESASILEGLHGDKLWYSIGSPLQAIGNFVITTSNKHPEATVRWIDYFYGEEGCKLFFMGKEGETFEMTPEGEYEFLDVIKNNPDGLTLDQAVGQFTSQPGGGYPGLLTNKFFKGAEGRPESIEGSEKLQPYFPKVIWPSNLYTVEQSEVMSSIGNDIDTYINESMAKFVRGDMSFSEWDNYVAQFDKMGLDQYMEVYKAATEKLFKE